MSYNGTVYCRYCYGKGHNKRTCPDYTNRLKERALEEIKVDGDYHGYWGKQYNKRVKSTGLYADGTAMSAEVIKANTKTSKRRCTYCGAQGHNKRTCAVWKRDTLNYVEEQIAWRKKLKAWAEEVGYGVGALLKVDRWGMVHAWMVTHVSWNTVDNSAVANYVARAELLGGGGKDSFALPTIEGLVDKGWNNQEMLSGVPTVHFPKDFLTEAGVAGPLKRRFEDAKSECYWDNYYN